MISVDTSFQKSVEPFPKTVHQMDILPKKGYIIVKIVYYDVIVYALCCVNSLLCIVQEIKCCIVVCAEVTISFRTGHFCKM